MIMDSEMTQVIQCNKAWLSKRRACQKVPIMLGVFDMSVFKRFIVSKRRKNIRLYLDQTRLGMKRTVMKQALEDGGTFSIGLLEGADKISYYDVISVRDMAVEDE